LVTHAVDFLHLADRIVILKGGEIQTVGSYSELIGNEYFKKIVHIHKKHKIETIQEDLELI